MTEREAEIVKDYNDYIFRKIAEKKSVPFFLAGTDAFLHLKAFNVPSKEFEEDSFANIAPIKNKWTAELFEEVEYSPFREPTQIDLQSVSFNQAMFNVFRRVMIQTFKNYNKIDTIVFFNRSYALAIFSLNTESPEIHYEYWSTLWDCAYAEKDTYCMELISACMVYRILEYENDTSLKNMMEDIYLRLEASKCGINLNTLEEFKIFTPAPAAPAPAMSNTSVQPVNDAVDDSTPSAKQGNIPLLQFKEEGGLDKWASLVKEAVKNIEDHTLNSRLDNTMFAVMFYFSSGWKKRKGIFKKAPTTTALVHFFLYRCDFNPEKVKPKTLVNRLNELFKGSKEIENTEEIERVKKKIQNIITKKS